MHQPLECSICYDSCPFPLQTWASAPPPTSLMLQGPQKKVQPSLWDSSCTCYCAPRRSSPVQSESAAPWEDAVSSYASMPSHRPSFLSSLWPNIHLKSTFSVKFSMISPGNEIAYSSGRPRHFLTLISDFPNCFWIICAHGILLHWYINCLRAVAVFCHRALGTGYRCLQGVLPSRFRQSEWVQGIMTEWVTTTVEKIPKHFAIILASIFSTIHSFTLHINPMRGIFIPILGMPAKFRRTQRG